MTTDGDRFRDRADAGRRIAEQLLAEGAHPDLVLALPRGGVPVGRAIADALGVPLDVLVVRKLGVPGHPELAMGAIGPGGVRVRNDDVVAEARVTDAALAQVEARERVELERRERAYRGGRPPLALEGRTVLLVDDGIATGATARAAIAVVRAAGASSVQFAAPVGAPEVVAMLDAQVDRSWVLEVPAWFGAVGEAYVDFGQVGDDAVRAALARP
jgi:putative phosphoribosyl transferase